MYQYYETEVATKIPKIHVVKGCNTTSFLHDVGKIKVPKNSKMEKKNSSF